MSWHAGAYYASVDSFFTNYRKQRFPAEIPQTHDILDWLVVSIPLKNMNVNGKDYPIYDMENKNVPNHQPVEKH